MKQINGLNAIFTIETTLATSGFQKEANAFLLGTFSEFDGEGQNNFDKGQNNFGMVTSDVSVRMSLIITIQMKTSWHEFI